MRNANCRPTGQQAGGRRRPASKSVSGHNGSKSHEAQTFTRAANVGELEGAGALALFANGADVVLVRAGGDGAPSKTAARIRVYRALEAG